MAIDAKMSFLRQLEDNCADKLTQKDLQKMLQICNDVLEGFDMREIAGWGNEGPDDMLDSFLASMKIQGRSEKTMYRYERMIRKFMEFAKCPTRRVSVYHIRNWLAAEKERGLKESTLEGCRQVLSSYFGWLHREDLIEKNPMNNIGAIKVPKKQKETFSDVEMAKLMAACKTLREKAILSFLASTACRVSEMCNLNRDQLNLKSQEVIVYGKGDKERVVYFDSVTADLLERYLKRRKDKDEALFVGQAICDKTPKRLQDNGVRVLLKRIAKRAGVQHVHPHKFRRTKATELARHGMPLQTVSHLLGHEKIETTMEYVMQKPEDVKNEYRRYA